MTRFAWVGRLALPWLLGAGLMLTAAEAERLRRRVGQPALCIGSVLLLRGRACPTISGPFSTVPTPL